MAKATPPVPDKTPAELGYTFPPEWHPHAATWLSWPRPEGVSFPGRYETIPPNLARIIREIAPREQVHINVLDESWKTIVRRQLKENGCPTRNIFFHFIKTNECWCRDHGPAFLLKRSQIANRKSQIAIVDWGFNGYGEKYRPNDDDDAVPTRIARELKLPVFDPGIILEGGSVDFNGAGTVMTTTSCLLNQNRNPRLSQQRIEKYLKDYYGQKHVIWLGDGLVGDDTDGHVDDLARFIGPRTIVFGVEDDPRDVNYKAIRDNLKRLQTFKDQSGLPFEIIEVPMPGVVEHKGKRLPATYMNFYFINGAVVVPTYRHKRNDQRAIAILQKQLPNHKVIGIDCVDLIWGLGAIHCITQQQPRT